MMDNNTVEKYRVFEARFSGPSEGNPFNDVRLDAVFNMDGESVPVNGFYDGDGEYVIRFMPEREGEWSFKTDSNVKELDGISGSFRCVEASKDNHGPVRVRNQYHFAYADGTNYFPFGTTCYAWIHQPEELREQTIKTLKAAPFNKIRMCVFPKNYVNNDVEPELYPYERRTDGSFDFERFNPKFFGFLEKQILVLDEMGIETDLILFHPYDKGRWGFDSMGNENDKRYLRYIAARLGAFKNIWWSMANEFDYVESKSWEDWTEYIKLLAKTDPYHHLLSIHNGNVLFDHYMPEITHASIQLGYNPGNMPQSPGQYRMLRDAYRKPVIYDEIGYEGNLPQRWGKLTAKQLADKFWKAIVSGTYASHGETYEDPNDIIWWAKGGILKGESHKMIAFLKDIIKSSGLPCLEPIDSWWIPNGVGVDGKYYLFYLGDNTDDKWRFELPGFKRDIPLGSKFRVDIIDAENMSITTLSDLYEIDQKERYSYVSSKTPYVKLPGRKMMAIRITISE